VPVSDSPRPGPAKIPDFSLWNRVLYPGFTSGIREIPGMLESIPQKIRALVYGEASRSAWIAVVGGTGTGKSTVFNALCDHRLSATGFDRPKTRGAIAYVHKDNPVEQGFPFARIRRERIQAESPDNLPPAGSPGELLAVEHDRAEYSHLVLVDTPDLDSHELKNRRIVDELALVADVFVFVSSQEKYADQTPFEFLHKIRETGKPVFVLLNKAESVFGVEDARSVLGKEASAVSRDRLWLLPYLPSETGRFLSQSPGFREFARALFRETDTRRTDSLLSRSRSLRRADLRKDLGRLLGLLEEEKRAAEGWKTALEAFFRSECEALLRQEEKRFTERSREVLQREIRALYDKYDLLGKPRRFVARVLGAPFRYFRTPGEEVPKSRAEHLARIRERFDLEPVLSSIEHFNRCVLENLSPPDPTAPIHGALRRETLPLTRAEIEAKARTDQERLLAWLEETFQQMSRGLPKSKEWGIYSASILWGALILALETALGGGIGLMQAVLDSVLAPFVTKGTVELFAYHEVENIARELNQRYRQALFASLVEQKNRYRSVLDGLTTSEKTRAELKSLLSSLD